MEKNAVPVISPSKSVQPLAKSVQPAEDQKIEAAFGNLELFIASHTENFYNISTPLPGAVFDFEPAGAATTKAALRRYIARNVLQLVRDENSTAIWSEEECRTKLLRELKPYTLNDSEKNDTWKKHLDDILKQGTQLAQMVSSQRGTEWRIGTFLPATTKPPNIVDVLVFPSLRKDGKEVRPEKKLRGTKKPKPTFRTAGIRDYFKRKNSIEPENLTLQHEHNHQDETKHQKAPVRANFLPTRVSVLVELLDLIIFLLQCLRALLVNTVTKEPMIPETADDNQDLEVPHPQALPVPDLKLPEVPRDKWTDWEILIKKIRQQEQGIQRSNTV